MGSQLDLYINGSTNQNNIPDQQAMTWLYNGNVGIGTSSPDAKLAVNGTIHSKEVKVDLSGWPDYVFDATYHLPALNQVKNYINQNHHLPDMPSAAEVVKSGLNLGEINKLLTKMVEELTLYPIEKDNAEKAHDLELQVQKRIILALTKRLEALEKQ